MKQGNDEPIRDYIDRYLEAYNRLPTKVEYGQIQCAKFIESLMRRNKEEVERSLKSKYDSNDNTHYPPNLKELFKFLEKNIGDIQEALFLDEKLCMIIEQDMEDVFEEFAIEHNYQYNEELSDNNKLDMIVHDHNKNNQLMCYNVEDLTEKEAGDLSPYTLLIMINNEKILAMLDTGADTSVINKNYDFEDRSIVENIIPAKGTLEFIDENSSVSRIGRTQPLEIRYRGKPVFLHSFEVMAMRPTRPALLVGKDLAPKLGITVSNLAHTFDDQEDISFADTVDEDKYKPNVTRACSQEEYEAFMTEMQPYLDANANINIHDLCPLKKAVVYLKTPPNKIAFTSQYPIAYELLPVVREQITKWEKDITIETARPSGFNSPLTLVPKATSDEKKKYRVCLDTRPINLLLEDVSNVNTPLIEDIFHSVREAKVFSVFDISGAFHRLEINEADRHKLTFTFEVHSTDIELHKEHCKMVIEAFTKNKMPINQEKTHLTCNSVYLLGFCISEQGKSIDPRRLTNIDTWPKPQTPKVMMKFCGWVSCMRAHLPNASELTAPLDHLSIVNILKSNIVLSHPDLNHEFSLSVDASNYAVGA
ncbi:Retrovirus-related Pol polyprotein from transposon opus, partial [Choanephora cucurbitarum]